MRVVILIVALVAIWPLGAQAEHSERFNTARHLSRSLEGTPLHGLGFAFEAEGWRMHLSPYFMVGASGTESSLGAAGCSGNRFNIWGLGACDRVWVPPRFQTWREAIRYYAVFIRSHWPHAQTLYDLAGYCECGSAAWGSKTYAWMQRLFGPVSTSLRYP